MWNQQSSKQFVYVNQKFDSFNLKRLLNSV